MSYTVFIIMFFSSVFVVFHMQLMVFCWGFFVFGMALDISKYYFLLKQPKEKITCAAYKF